MSLFDDLPEAWRPAEPRPTASVSAPFDPADPIATGLTVLEASAGTGKTYAVSSLVAAEVVRGRPLEAMLVVSFTNAATGELRDRVWRRLREAVDAVRRGTDDPVARAADVAGVAPAVAVDRLDHALSAYDRATIVTLHTFARQMLAGLGVAGDDDRHLRLIEDIRPIVADATDDLYVRKFHDTPSALDPARSHQLALKVVDNPDTVLAPGDTDDETKLRRGLATGVRRRVAESMAAAGLVGFNDLLGHLRASVLDEVTGPGVVARLRDRFTLAVVDEFQDTDAWQWDILKTAFVSPTTSLVVVGDPKQAIYRFRGGDVHTYLAASGTAGDGQRRSLARSWRSDQPVLDGVGALFGPARLGHEQIAVTPLLAQPDAATSRISNTSMTPVAVRLLTPPPGPRPGRDAPTDAIRAAVNDDVAAVASRLLAEARIHDRPLVGRQIAVLVNANWHAAGLAAALGAAGIPSVIHASDSVFTTQAAVDWLHLLRAIDQPARATLAYRLAVTSWLGFDADTMAAAGDGGWEAVHERVHEWAIVARTDGLAALARAVDRDQRVDERLRGVVGGERQLTDLRHLGELLHAHHRAHPSPPGMVADWLGTQIREAQGREDAPDRRRLESDAEAVAIMTVHAAKGREFDVVLLPTLWDKRPAEIIPVFHDESGRRAIDVGAGGPHHQHARSQAETEAAGEELRLVYVALTRARHQVVAWFTPSYAARRSPLARLLVGIDPSSHEVDQELRRAPSLGDLAAAIDQRGEPALGCSLLDAPAGPVPVPTVAPPQPGALRVARFDRGIDLDWRRTSYSGLTAGLHEEADHVVEWPDEQEPVADEPDGTELGAPGADADDQPAVGSSPLPLGELPGGARFGTMVHELLERTDFATADLPASLAGAAAAARVGGLLDDAQRAQLIGGLAEALACDVDVLGRPLAGLASSDRLDELAFDLPLAGGDAPNGHVTIEAIAEAFARLPADDRVAGYHERLADPRLAVSVRGYLTGSIDLVARAGATFVAIDYKTNRLAPPGVDLTAAHYDQPSLTEAMFEAHYPLQAGLYLVALHRYLRWRLPGYDPDRHLGGAAWLFLRGMAADAPPGSGVFSWRPPTSFVTGLSDVLAGTS